MALPASWQNIRTGTPLASARSSFNGFKRWYDSETWKTAIEAYVPPSLQGTGPRPIAHSATALASEAILGYADEYPIIARERSEDVSYHVARSKKRKEALVKERAEIDLTVEKCLELFRRKAKRIMYQIAFGSWLEDAQGNALTGQAAVNKRIELYNKWGCLFYWNEEVDGLNYDRRVAAQALAWLREAGAETPPLSESKELEMERFDNATRDYCVRQFGAEEPRNAQQQTVRYAALRERQKLERAVESAVSATAASAAADTAIAAVEALEVQHAPNWTDAAGEPLHSRTLSAAYTTGSTPWKLDLTCFSTGSSPGGARADTYGYPALLPFVDEDFEVVSRTPTTPITGDLYLRVQRKTGATGHPAAGEHVFTLEARNFQGIGKLVVTVTVPAPSE